VLKDLTDGGFVAVLDQECNEGIRITDRGRALTANPDQGDAADGVDRRTRVRG
jgi:hypothetical protein